VREARLSGPGEIVVEPKERGRHLAPGISEEAECATAPKEETERRDGISPPEVARDRVSRLLRGQMTCG